MISLKKKKCWYFRSFRSDLHDHVYSHSGEIEDFVENGQFKLCACDTPTFQAVCVILRPRAVARVIRGRISKGKSVERYYMLRR